MPAKKLSDAEITVLLSKARGWSMINGKLRREFACKDFVTAFAVGAKRRVFQIAHVLQGDAIAGALAARLVVAPDHIERNDSDSGVLQ